MSKITNDGLSDWHMMLYTCKHASVGVKGLSIPYNFTPAVNTGS